MSSSKPRVDTKCLRTCILLSIAILILRLVLYRFIAFYVVDIIIFAAIFLLIISPLLKGNASGWFVTKRCGACGGPLPKDIGAGQRCPNCGVYFSHEVNQFRDTGTKKRWYQERGLISTKENNASSFRRDSRVSVGDDQDEQFRLSETNPENSPFDPPFDGLFKDQEDVKHLFSRFVNWVAVGKSLKNWARCVVSNVQRANDASLDATAKVNAWKKFERKGFSNPSQLPDLYIAELAKILRSDDRRM